MKISSISIYSITLSGLLLFSCSSDEPHLDYPTSPTINLSRSEESINTNINDFGISIFNHIAGDQQIYNGRNFAISPVSISLCLAMCANTLDDDFRNRISETFGCNDVNELNILSRKLMMYLPDKSNACEMSIANSVWHLPELIPSESYKDIITDFYFGETTGLDLRIESSADLINQWAIHHTHNQICNITDYTRLKSAFMFIANAIYFKSDWKEAFDPQATKRMTFHAPDTDMTAEFMHAKRQLKYHRSEDLEAVVIPYKGSYDFIAVNAVDPAGFDNICSLSNSDLEDIYAKLKPYNVDLSMPKFSSEFSMRCNDIFKEAGISLDCDNFSGFNPIYDTVSDIAMMVDHFTKVETNENGTVAAATTTGEIILTSPGIFPVGNVSLTLDRPFVYLIRNSRTGSIIMIGLVTKP